MYSYYSFAEIVSRFASAHFLYLIYDYTISLPSLQEISTPSAPKKFSYPCCFIGAFCQGFWAWKNTSPPGRIIFQKPIDRKKPCAIICVSLRRIAPTGKTWKAVPTLYKYRALPPRLCLKLCQGPKKAPGPQRQRAACLPAPPPVQPYFHDFGGASS